MSVTLDDTQENETVSLSAVENSVDNMDGFWKSFFLAPSERKTANLTSALSVSRKRSQSHCALISDLYNYELINELSVLAVQSVILYYTTIENLYRLVSGCGCYTADTCKYK